MSDFLDRISKLSPKRLALLALELHEKVEAADAAASNSEAIAVVGIGCRFPGGIDSPETCWDALGSGRDTVRVVPPERWDIDTYFDADVDKPGKISTRYGGFLDSIDTFDPAFFGISPREALTMDPQQRLALEVSWEALEHAGLSPERLAGSATGVYFGLCNSDHFQRVLQRGAHTIDAYLASGNAHSVAAGRISYFLGFQGPAIAIDTACSSSLVALHLACRALRGQEVRMALAGGVNIMCSPETTIALTKAHMLAPDGRCKAFDASADGFSRGEGCGVVVLKRLSDAQADGDRILALIRGTASNQDGRSGGLTVPNGPAQEAVIRAALADAGVSPRDIQYVEAHGTGTSLGDPIEIRALAGALGAGHSHEHPLWVGSAKTNFGHLESAAGIAGIIKVVLSLQHEQIPPHLHFKTPSPHIDWSQYPIGITATGHAWPREQRRRLAGVSSFGFSGTNAHVILEEAPLPVAIAAPPPRPLQCLPLSARSAPALRDSAERHAAAVSGLDLADAAFTAGVGRSHFGERLAVVAADAAEAAQALREFATGSPAPQIRRGSAAPGVVVETVFLFTGQGSQYPDMSRQLYGCSPVYRQVIDRCEAILGADASGRTLTSVLFPTDGNECIHETAWTQPALFAVEYALAQLWRSWGIEPAAVIGHSVGEYIAACVAGVFSLEEGLRLIAERGRLMQVLPAGGTMAAIFAPVAEVAAAVAPLSARLAIAAINADDSVVISGEAAAVEEVLAAFARRNVQGHRLFVSLAAHSPLVEPALDAMETCARSVHMQAPRIPVAWNVTGGEPLSGGAPDARYWRRHLREPVRFSEGIARLHSQGFTHFLEVGPHPTLIALAQRSLPAAGVCFLTSLRRGKQDWRELMTSLAELYVRGAPVDWAGVDVPYASRRVTLPTYPFERRSFWIPAAAPSLRVALPADESVLAGTRLPTAVPLYETTFKPGRLACLEQHRVHGAVLVAGPVFIEMAQSAALLSFTGCRPVVEDFVIRQPLVLPEEGRVVQTQLAEDAGGALRFSIHSRALEGTGQWQLHASGVLREADAGDTPQPEAVLCDLQATLPAASGCGAFYDTLSDLGIELGPLFRSLQSAQSRPGESLTLVELPEGCRGDSIAWVHPALLDGALQSVGLAIADTASSDSAYLLTAVGRLELRRIPPNRLYCHVRVRPAGSSRPAQWLADAILYSEDGVVLGGLSGVCLRRASKAALTAAAGGTSSWFYSVSWTAAPVAPRAARALRSPVEFAPDLRQQFEELALEQGLSVYSRLLPALDRLSAAHIGAAFAQLGFAAPIGRVFETDAEAQQLGVAARHRRLFARLLALLTEEGVLRLRGEGRYEVIAALPGAEAALDYDELLQEFGDVSGELCTLRRCGPHLAAVLRGSQDPLQLLFPNGSFAEARQLYVDSPYARTYNGALAHALQSAVAGLEGSTTLRVLEIGAGTGGTTGYVLPALSRHRVEYTFTDLSPLFLERAKEQFSAYPFLRYALLDIGRDPLEQGFKSGQFDLVIAANVLHATADLRATLQRVHSVLAPGGILLVLEGVAPERWVDLTFGLTEGWWMFTDSGLRNDYPLIGREAWTRLLLDSGFSDAVVVPAQQTQGRGASQQALLLARSVRPVRRWTLLTDGGGIAAALAQRLTARGDAVTMITAHDTEAVLDQFDDIVYCGALDLARTGIADTAAAASSSRAACEWPLRWLARVAAAEGAGRVWLLTQASQQAGGDGAPGAAWQAPLWGLGRVFALEHPSRWGGLIDLPLPDDATTIDALLSGLDAEDGEDQTAWRMGHRLAARLLPVDAPVEATLRLRPDATYLITGGFGGLGLTVARWMVEHGARHLALLGRHPALDDPAVIELQALGVGVTGLAADVGDEASLAPALQSLQHSGAPLRGIVHTAADIDAALIEDLTHEQLRRMLRPKLDGTVLLERLTRSLELDLTVYFSSSTALLGASGFAHYAAANTFLDAFAAGLNRPDRRVLSVNWGTWEVMRLATSETQRSYREGGLQPMPAELALDALQRVMNAGWSQAMVAQIDWAILKPLHEARRMRPFLSALGARLLPRASEAVPDSGPSLRDRLAAVTDSMRSELMLDFVRTEASAVLGLDSLEPIPLDTGLFDLGMDSLMSVELKRRLEHGAGKPLPSTLTFNYPTVTALAAFIEKVMALDPGSAALPLQSGTDTARTAPESVNLDELSDDELEARLLKRLEQSR